MKPSLKLSLYSASIIYMQCACLAINIILIYSVFSSNSPIITFTTVDTAYEGMQKRTYLIMLVLVILLSPFVVEIIVLYRKLEPSTNPLGSKKDELNVDSK